MPEPVADGAPDPAESAQLMVVTNGIMGAPRLQFSRPALRRHPFCQREAAWARRWWRFHLLTVACVLAATCWYPVFKGWDWRALPMLAAAEILLVSTLFELPHLRRFARLRQSGWFAELLLTPWPPAATVGAFLMVHRLGRRFAWAALLFFATIGTLALTYLPLVGHTVLAVSLLPFLIGLLVFLRLGRKPGRESHWMLDFDDLLRLFALVDLPLLGLLLILLPSLPLLVMSLTRDLGPLPQLLLGAVAIVPITLGHGWVHRRVMRTPESGRQIMTLDDLNERIRAFATEDDLVSPP